VRQGGARQGRARIAEQREDVLLLDQLEGVLAGTLHDVGIVQRLHLDLAPVDAAGFVDLAEVRERAVADVDAKVLVGPRQRRGLAEHDDALGLERRANQPEQCGGKKSSHAIAFSAGTCRRAR